MPMPEQLPISQLDPPDHYTRYPYPPYDPGDEHRRLYTTVLDKLDQVGDACFEGRIDPADGLKVLDAGGGTGSATIFLAEQLRDTPSRVTYLDLSPNSQALARQGAAARGLEDTVEWRQGSLLDLPETDNETYDYVTCSGVLHALPDPQLGLNALKRVLKPDGGMGIFLYATYGRRERYRMQDSLRHLTRSAGTTSEAIAIARRLVHSQTDEWKQQNPAMLREIETDSGVYDMLLPRYDQPFSVPDIYQWAESAGLHVSRFVSPNNDAGLGYEPERYLNDDYLKALAADMPEPDRRALAERLSNEITKHFFYLTTQPNRSASMDDPEMVPSLSMSFGDTAFRALSEVSRQPGARLRLFQAANSEGQDLPLGELASPILESIGSTRNGGNQTIPAIIEGVAGLTGKSTAEVRKEFDRIVRPLHALGWITLRHRLSPQLPTAADLQQRQHRRNGADKAKPIRVLDGLALSVTPALGVPSELGEYNW